MLALSKSLFKGIAARKNTGNMQTSDPNIQRAISNIAATRKTSFNWIRDRPHRQSYYTYNESQSTWDASDGATNNALKAAGSFTTLSLLTWNIDFMLPFTSQRMTAALKYLQSVIFEGTGREPRESTIVFLQEMLVSDLKLLQATKWVQDHFHLTDLDSTHWESGYYGTVSLIDKRSSIKDVFRVHYSATKMERDGLFVDLEIDGKVIRCCNTHLESLVASPPLRPEQMETAAKHMHDQSVHASVLAGDLNAIQPFDRTLHADNGLKDAFIELGGDENSDEGHTWGQQAQTHLREQFGTSRMDKFFYCGGLQVKKLDKIGLDVEVDEEQDRESLRQQGLERGWVTDHLGLKAEFDVLSNKYAHE